MPAGTFLSKRMRKTVSSGVSQNRLDLIHRDLELFCDFGNAHAEIEIIDNGVGRHACITQHRSAALHCGLDFDQRAFRPVDCLFDSHGPPATMIPCFRSERQKWCPVRMIHRNFALR